MSNKIFLGEVSKWFKCYILVKNFDQKPAISLKTLKIGFFNTLLWLNQGFGVLLEPLNLSYMAVIESIYILSRNPCAFAINICFSSKKLAVTKTTSEYIAGLQDPSKDKWTGKVIINWNQC